MPVLALLTLFLLFLINIAVAGPGGVITDKLILDDVADAVIVNANIIVAITVSFYCCCCCCYCWVFLVDDGGDCNIRGP